MERAKHPEYRLLLRVIESWGPYPIQPVVVRSSLADEVKTQIAAHLSDLEAGAGLAGIPFERFAPVTYEDYLSVPAVVEAAGMIGEDAHL